MFAFGLTGVQTTGLVVGVLLLIAALALLYWLARASAWLVAAPFRFVRRRRKRREPHGLGAEYEKLVLSQSRRHLFAARRARQTTEPEATAPPRASATGILAAYRRGMLWLISWLVSLVLSLAAILVAVEVTEAFASKTVGGLVALIVLVCCVLPWWVWTKRHYGRLPLIRFVDVGPKELEQFRAWQASQPTGDTQPREQQASWSALNQSWVR